MNKAKLNIISTSTRLNSWTLTNTADLFNSDTPLRNEQRLGYKT